MSVRLDADFWAARMAYLSKLAHADALAVVLEMRDDGFVTYVSDNLPSDVPWNGAALGPVLRGVLDSRAAARADTVLPLGDGRAASAVHVAPIVWNEQLVGALVALRASGAFDDREAAEVARVADLV